MGGGGQFALSYINSQLKKFKFLAQSLELASIYEC
jgi:hypothetical protein